MKTRGFSLIEMLIAALVGSVILVVIAQGFRGSMESFNFVQNSQALSEDTRIAGNVISDYLTLAAFIYPPGSTLTLGTNTEPSVRNPNVATTTGRNVWRIGSDPAIAMLIPSATADGRPLQFVMFYAINRGDLVGGVAANSHDNPGADASNADKRLLYMYTATLSLTYIPNTPYPTTIPYTITGTGRLMADYIRPTGGFNPVYNSCLNFDATTRQAITRACPTVPPVGVAGSAVDVGFSLQGEISRSSKVTRVPITALGFRSAPRNLPRNQDETIAN
jgi:prepilin-type N-terminal cleavage/methylation domain-containing protein